LQRRRVAEVAPQRLVGGARGAGEALALQTSLRRQEAGLRNRPVGRQRIAGGS